MRPTLNIALLLLVCGVACGLSPFTTRSQAEVRVEAWAGQPWGVGKVTVDVRPGTTKYPLGDDRFILTSKSGQVFYPVVENARVRALLRQLIGIESPRRVTFLFLFQGDAPLDLQVYAPTRGDLQILPRQDDRAHAELFEEWWEEYAGYYDRIHRQAEYPAVAQTYLTALWSVRLDTPMPMPSEFLLRDQQQGGTFFPQLLADEGYRASLARDMMLGERREQRGARRELEQEKTLLSDNSRTDSNSRLAPQDSKLLEPLSAYVPAECFYLRFGSFPNYLWFRDFLDRWNGDIQNMLVLRSIRRPAGERIEEQLAIRESSLSRILGPSVISDVAMIGLDPYLRDGAAFGILFHAKNNFLLKRNFTSQWEESKENHPGSTIETVEIAGHEVQHHSTADGRVRSYYAQVGDFHLMTTSRKLVERFFEASEGKSPLAHDPDFQAARKEFALDENHTVFAHVSAPFLKNITGLHYRVELDRRLRSSEEIRLIKLAQLTAAHEGDPATTTEELIAAGYLPPSFGARSDASKLEMDDQGFGRDSIRGSAGRYLPIADMEVKEISAAEQDRYEKFVADQVDQVGELPPLTFAMRREEASAGVDHVWIDAALTPLAGSKAITWTSKLGPASVQRVPPIAGDAIALQVILPSITSDPHPVLLFGALRDCYFPLGVEQGGLTALVNITQAVRGYIGAWPRPQWIERYVGRISGNFDEENMAQTAGPLGIWAHAANDFFLFSFKRDVLAEVAPQLAIVEDARPAQIRLAVADVSQADLGRIISAAGFSRAYKASASGSRFMNALSVQLGHPREECRALAEELIEGEFVCPLGGDYVLVEPKGGLPTWVSTAAVGPNQYSLFDLPPDFRLPLLNWFRGLSADIACYPESAHLHAELDMSTLNGEQPEPDQGPLEQPKVPAIVPPQNNGAEELPPPPAEQ